MFGRKNVRMSAVESPAWYGVTYIYRSCVFVYLTKTFSWTIAGTNICTSHGSRQYSLRAVEMASLVAKEFQTDRPQCSQESTTLKTGLNRRRRTFMWKSMQLHHQSALSQESWRIHYSFFFISMHKHGQFLDVWHVPRTASLHFFSSTKLTTIIESGLWSVVDSSKNLLSCL